MRNDSDGTVLRAVSEAGETKCRSGKVRWPAERACTWTVASVVSKGGEGGAVCLTKIEDIFSPLNRIEFENSNSRNEEEQHHQGSTIIAHNRLCFTKLFGIMSHRVW